MSQYDHTTHTCTKKPLSHRLYVLNNWSGLVQLDAYSAFPARCVMSNTHHQSNSESLLEAQNHVLLQNGWLRDKPSKIEPSGKITVVIQSERCDCKRGLASGHRQDAALARREHLVDHGGLALRSTYLSQQLA